MNQKYIEREAAKAAVVKAIAESHSAFNAIVELPAADVVPVVRCGECVFHEISDYGGGCTKNVCSLWNRQIQDDDYCSYGLIKDGDKE